MLFIKKLNIILFSILLLGISKSSYSQHLNFQEILNLYKGNADHNDEYLRKKLFVLQNSKKYEKDNTIKISWMYKRNGSNSQSSNEYFMKECKSLFAGECDMVTYMTSDAIHFAALKTTMKQSFNKFLFSDTNNSGVLSHSYMIPGPIEAKFSTIPRSAESTVSVYVLQLRKIEVNTGN